MVMPFNFGNIMVFADVLNEIGQVPELNFGEIVPAVQANADAVGVVTEGVGADGVFVAAFLDGPIGLDEIMISDIAPWL